MCSTLLCSMKRTKTKPTYHGATSLKAVDILAEGEEHWYYIEVKNFYDPALYGQDCSEKQLREILKYKFRDTYLYRYAENKIAKPIIYICLLVNLENPLCTRMRKTLLNELPIGRPTPRWQFELVQNCIVVNIDRWNKNFPNWPVHHVQ